MAEVTAMAVAEVEAVMAEAAVAIVMGTVLEVPIGRMEGHMPETAAGQIMAVTGTVAAVAVTVMQVATDMPVLVEVHHGTRQAAPETGLGLMTGPVGDPVAMMIVIENMSFMMRPVDKACANEEDEEEGGPSVFGST